ncbi:MAG TPA: hypothetical protein VGL57_00110 [Solirubrobacteraceae bacterium]
MQGEPFQQRVALSGAWRFSLGQKTRVALFMGAPALLIGVLVWPLLFTGGVPSPDWANHLLYMWLQSEAIRTGHHPSFFINYSHSVFYPEYAFYGGTLYAVVGTLSLLLGNAPIETYVSTWVMGFAASYGGWYWMAHMAGLRRYRAHVPGLVFITSAYYLTLVYARGDWPEFTGVSMLPLLIASGLSVLRADRLRFWPALALGASSVMFFGSHSLTIVWGSTVSALTGVLVVLFVPEVRRWLTWRSSGRVALLVVPALLVSAWFLLPTAIYQAHTLIGIEYPYWRVGLRDTMFMVSAHNLFTLSRASFIQPGADFALSLPILAMAWSLVCIPIFWRGGLRGAWGRVFLICAAVTVLMTIVMTQAGLMLALPRPYAILQFAYRLESYVILALSGTVLAALVVAQKGVPRMRAWAWALVPVLAVSVVGAIQQASAYPKGGDRSQSIRQHAKPGPTERGLSDYIDGSLPVVRSRGGQPPQVNFSFSAVRGDHISKVVHLRPGTLVYSNVGGGPELVHVTGAKIVGISPIGLDALEIGAAATSPPAGSGASRSTEVISLSTASTWPVVLGRILTVSAMLFLLGFFVVLGVRRARTRAHA